MSFLLGEIYIWGRSRYWHSIALTAAILLSFLQWFQLYEYLQYGHMYNKIFGITEAAAYQSTGLFINVCFSCVECYFWFCFLCQHHVGQCVSSSWPLIRFRCWVQTIGWFQYDFLMCIHWDCQRSSKRQSARILFPWSPCPLWPFSDLYSCGCPAATMAHWICNVKSNSHGSVLFHHGNYDYYW